MRAPSIVALATALLGGALAMAQTARPPRSPLPSPGVVLGELHSVNTLEVALGTLAQSRASDAEVKKLGQAMVKSHTRMDARGTEYAKQHRLTVTAPPNDPEHQVEDEANAARKRKLEGLQGPEFDRAYVQSMADGHRKLLDKLTAWEGQAVDKNLQAFIADASKEVAQHKQQAEQLLTQLGKSASR